MKKYFLVQIIQEVESHRNAPVLPPPQTEWFVLNAGLFKPGLCNVLMSLAEASLYLTTHTAS